MKRERADCIIREQKKREGLVPTNSQGQSAMTKENKIAAAFAARGTNKSSTLFVEGEYKFGGVQMTSYIETAKDSIS